MCPSDLQQLWKDVSGVPSSEEALKQAEGLDLSTNSSNSTSAFPKAASAHLPLHSLPNGQSHTPKRDRYSALHTLYEGCVVPWLCWLIMGLSPSLRARLFEWISSFTKADSGDDHVPLYSKGSQPPSSQ